MAKPKSQASGNTAILERFANFDGRPSELERLLDLGTQLEAFCSERLNADYLNACLLLLDELQYDESPIYGGKSASSAAGLAHAIGAINFLFDESQPLSIPPTEIAAYFGVSTSTMNRKSKEIRDWLDLSPLDVRFMTESLKQSPEIADLQRTLGLMIQLPNLADENWQPQHLVVAWVELLDVPLPVNRIFVMEDGSLDDLHWMIQGAMGWESCHMHQFRRGNTIYVDPDSGLDEMDGLNLRVEPTTAYLTSEFLDPQHRRPLIYEYDFGDGWRHAVYIDRLLPIDENRRYPICIGGKNACPPEDCGGPFGYANLLDALADEKHPDHDEMMEIYGAIDPHRFDAKAQTEEMHHLIDELLEPED